MEPLKVNDEKDKTWPLSGSQPYFSIVLSRTHVQPSCQMFLPVKIQKVFLSNPCPVVLTCRGKKWNMSYIKRRFDPKWRDFVIDNDLNAGDACVFEMVTRTKTLAEFRVQILRGDIPSEFMNNEVGETADTPIMIE